MTTSRDVRTGGRRLRLPPANGSLDQLTSHNAPSRIFSAAGALASPHAGTHDVLALQRAAGNRAVATLLAAHEDFSTAPPALVQRFPVTVENRGAAHPFTGGTSVVAKVGRASQWAYGSAPAGGVPTLLTRVGAVLQGSQRYIAGHLLNDNMGGLGVNNNLTVLSSTANKAHRGIEGKIKNLAAKADQIHPGSAALGSPAFDHGARYTVAVLAPAPAGNPPFAPAERRIGAGIQVSIDPIRVHKVTGAESPWPEEVGKANDLTNHVIPNVPPYPLVKKKKKPTPTQKAIIAAISAVGGPVPAKAIFKYIAANITHGIKRSSVNVALRRGVSTKFFFVRNGGYSVITKNVT